MSKRRKLVKIHPVEFPTMGRPYRMILPGGGHYVEEFVWRSYLEGLVDADDVMAMSRPVPKQFLPPIHSPVAEHGDQKTDTEAA